ncbi:hypothetical protein BH10PSE18_BH10PSE18_17300 [soil metagenome]
MVPARLRERIASSLIGWCVCGFLLAALQPFIATHFRQDGWEDEPGFRIRSVSATAEFEPDERSEHANWHETTLFVPASASIDLPDALQHGLDRLLALVLVALPLTVLLAALVPRATQPLRIRRIPNPSGAPPPTACWLRQPPSQAPPSMH